MNRMTPAELADELNKVSETLLVAIRDNLLSTLDRELTLERLRHIYDAFRALDFVVPVVDRTDVLSAYLGETKEEVSDSQAAEDEPFLGHNSIDREVIETLYGRVDSEPELESEKEEPVERLEIVSQPTSRLRQSIGLNGRIMLLTDLFDGDEARYEKTIDVLERADSIDDAYIYLYEHFTLDDNKDGVRCLIALLESNFS